VKTGRAFSRNAELRTVPVKTPCTGPILTPGLAASRNAQQNGVHALHLSTPASRPVSAAAAAKGLGKNVYSGNSPDDSRREEIESWIRQAKEGSIEARGRLLEACAEYLRRAAGRLVSPELRAKFAPSDLVQETALDVHRDFDQFRGDRLEELLAWVRRILLDNAASVHRRYQQVAKRQISREISIEASSGVAAVLHDQSPSPRSLVSQLEKQRQVDDALQRLPPDQRRAILLRSRDHLSFAEVGRELARSEDAARKLWFRAIERLRTELSATHGHN
jgi:RNA polymerase sigma-70 factor (ECF subfamily)